MLLHKSRLWIFYEVIKHSLLPRSRHKITTLNGTWAVGTYQIGTGVISFFVLLKAANHFDWIMRPVAIDEIMMMLFLMNTCTVYRYLKFNSMLCCGWLEISYYFNYFSIVENLYFVFSFNFSCSFIWTDLDGLRRENKKSFTFNSDFEI